MTDDITDFQWDNIILPRIKAGRCVPFLGAAVNVDEAGRVGPLGPHVATHLVKKLSGMGDDDISRLSQVTYVIKKLAEMKKDDLDNLAKAVQLIKRLPEVAEEDLSDLEGVTKIIQRLAGLKDESLAELTQIIQRLKGYQPETVHSAEYDLAQVITHRKFVRSKHYTDLTRLALQNLPRVALHTIVESGWDYDILVSLLREVLADDERQPSKLLRVLARLPFELIVTTNFDRLMERALDEIGRPYELVEQPLEGFETDAQEDLLLRLSKPKGVILYKLHGTFPLKGQSAQSGSRIIITEEDYIKFLTVIGREDERGVPGLIKSRIIDSTLLFLGYSLEDWDFRTLFKGLIEGLAEGAQRVSYAIQKEPPEFWQEVWKKKNVEIFDLDLTKFTDDLEAKWEAFGGK
jgi:hypothetical protein